MPATIPPDEHQRRVVDHDGGPLLVLGGPGTGKTQTLIERWIRLGREVTEPHRVLMLVPLRERALALRDELPWRLDARAVVDVPVHTWHALAYHLVTRYYRRLGYAQPPVRLTNAEQWAVVRDLLGAEDPAPWSGYAEHVRTDAFVSEVADFCVRAGHRGLTDEDLVALGERRPEHATVAAFALRYRAHLTATGALDYPSLILGARRLLEEDAGIAEAVRRRFTHVLVDDSHELAPAQLQLLRCLNTDHVVCAGDPDSAIEAFRGADPGWLHRFADLAPGHGTIVLADCHRHGKTIGEVARRLIEHGAPADHRPAAYTGEDGVADLRCYATMAGEIEAAARLVRTAHLLDGVPYDRMAVLLAQPGTYLHPLARMLDTLHVPWRVDAGDRPLTAEPPVVAVLGLCRTALHPDPDDDLMSAVLSSPMIGLDPYRVRELKRVAFKQQCSLGDVVEDAAGAEVEEYRRLRDVVRDSSDDTADDTFARLFEASAWCRTLTAERTTNRDAAHQIDALVAFARALGHFVERHPGGTLRDYLGTSAQAGFATDAWTPSDRRRGVHLLSLHASKGLEWDVVCVLGVAEGLIPRAHRAQGLFDPWALELGSAIDRSQAQLAEERRTLYVALTRARRALHVSCSPGTKRAVPSRFCEEAFGEIPEPIPPDAQRPPLTLQEAEASLRRILATPDASDDERNAAAAALAGIPGVDPARWWWRRSWTEGRELVPDGKLTTSYSRIGRYDECPLRYVLESVLGLDPQSTYQMKFGSLVHRIFERADPHGGDITELDDAISIYRDEFTSHHKDDYPNIVFARTYYKFGVQALKRWWHYERSAGRTVAVEYAFNDLDIDGHTIRGRIDRVATNDRGVVLSDYKTSRNAIRWQDAKDSLQLAIYYAAAKHYDDLKEHGEPVLMQLIYPGIEKQPGWNDDEPGCVKRYQRPDEADDALTRLRRLLDEAADERFAPDPAADCQWCRMKPLCPRWPEGKEIPR